ncbi:MAG: NAD(P)-dependent oxidoreductase [Flavobacteriales bacterium]|nr:NAD(P)-dependent oxidoreductase [Flavobacteriales bacterium]
MNILIVGGNSAMAISLKEYYSPRHNIITAGRKKCDIELDLSKSIDDLILPKNIDVLIHTAANFGGRSYQEIMDAEEVNVLGTIKICEIAKKSNIKHLIIISSMSASLPENSLYYNIYAISKRHAEEVALLYCKEHSLPLTVLRPSQIYGNFDNFRLHQPLIYLMLDKAKKNEDITIYGSKDALRNYIHMDDLSKIIEKTILNKVVGLYSCLYPENQSYSQIAKAAFLAFGASANIIFNKEKDDIPDNIFKGDNSLYEKIKYYPEISIYEGFKKMKKTSEKIK